MREDNQSDIGTLNPNLMNSLSHRIYELRYNLQHTYGGIFIALGMFPDFVSMNPFPKFFLLFCVLGYYFSSPQCFITGVLSEFSFELLDTVCANSLLSNVTSITLSIIKLCLCHFTLPQYTIIKQRFITKKGQHSADRVPFWGFVLGMMHHSGAITVMLPACTYYLTICLQMECPNSFESCSIPKAYIMPITCTCNKPHWDCWVCSTLLSSPWYLLCE